MKMLHVIYLAIIINQCAVKCLTVEESLKDTFNFKESNLTDWNNFTEPPHDSVEGDYALKPVKGFPKEPLPNAESVTCDKKITFIRTPDIIKKYGYEFELLKVHTEDGYILGVFRISGSPISPPRQGKIPVYLNHGLMGNALSWLFLYGENSLGYYDLPAVIDHILNVTLQKDVYYISHSLGTAQYMVAMSERPEYNAKIRMGFLLCPAAFVHRITHPGLKILLHLVTPIYEAWKLLFGNFMNQKALKDSPLACEKDPLLGCGTCDHLAFFLNGYNPRQNNVSIAAYFNKRYYDTTSTKVFTHLSQSAQFRTFSQFDYVDPLKNLKKYGTKTPPAYKMESITAPTVIYWGYSDSVTTSEDVKQTAQMFSPGVVKENNRVIIQSFTHLDFLIANDVQKYVYNRIQYIMDKTLYVNETKNKNF